MSKTVVYHKGRITIGKRTLVARTCDLCGLILGSKHYQKKKYTWANVCNSCCTKRQVLQGTRTHGNTVLQYHTTQNKSLATATRKGTHWTLTELDLIVEMLDKGMTKLEIAIAINRSLGGVRGAVARYELQRGWPKRELWIIHLT